MAQQYGTVKVDVLTYTSGTDGNETDVSINVSGLGRVSESGITITGDIQGDNITATGDLFVSGDANIDGNATISGNTGVSGLLTVSGITVTGDAGVSGLLTVSSITTTGNATVSGTLDVSGLATFSGITVTGDATISGNTGVSGNLTADNVTGTTSVSGGVLYANTLISGNLDGGVYGSGYWKIPAGTTAERPGTSATGMIRYNEDLAQFEGFDGNWNLLGGGATGSGGDRVFVLNEQTVTTSFTLPSGENATSCGPIYLDPGVTVTIGTGENWSIV